MGPKWLKLLSRVSIPWAGWLNPTQDWSGWSNIYIWLYIPIVNYIYKYFNILLYYYIINIYIIDSKSFSRVMPCLYVWHLQLQTMAWAKRFPRHRPWRWYLQKMILLWKMNMLNFFPPIKTCLHLATYEHLYWCQVGKIFEISYRHQHPATIDISATHLITRHHLDLKC